MEHSTAQSRTSVFCHLIRGVYYIFPCTAQGSRGAVLTWAAVAAILGRIVQSLFCDGNTQDARLQVYVDDPIFGIRVTKRKRKRSATKCVSTFLLLGLHMAFLNAQIN